jgi:GMP synthase (glutamine-hydrolysing)
MVSPDAARLRFFPSIDHTMKTALALRHLAFEDLGLLEPWLRERGWQVRHHDVGVEPLDRIALDAVDLLVVLGGPIGAEDDERYPFLAGEVALVRERLGTGRPLLGICLGAQLMARALGARVQPMGAKEIGYAPLELSDAGRSSPLATLDGQPVLHWHGDQFALPSGLPSLAASPACPHQAFMAGPQAMAWQFHLEVDAHAIERWLIGHALELQQAGIAPQALRDDARRHADGLRRALHGVMARWMAAWAESGGRVRGV